MAWDNRGNDLGVIEVVHSDMLLQGQINKWPLNDTPFIARPNLMCLFLCRWQNGDSMWLAEWRFRLARVCG
jgi:hypothetical protein